MVAGLVATTLEETRKLPTRVITFPMSAVSRGLQAGMRLQQNVAELAIKGDEFLAPYCDTAEEQPEWAHFDEDDEAPEPLLPDAPARVEAARDDAGDSSTVAPSTVAPKAQTNGSAPSKPAPKKPAATKPAAKKAAAKKPAATAAEAEPPAANAGRFALYSSTPVGVADASPASRAADVADEDVPDVVAVIDYQNLTLAQLRAKVRGLSVEELTEIRDFEKAGRNRTPFVTMIDNRIVSQQKKSESAR